MGIKFVSTHVRTDDADAVATALCEIAQRNRLTRVSADEPCDVEVVLFTKPGSPQWVSMFGRFDDVLDSLSSELSTHALSTEIFDADVLTLALYREGALVDRFCSG